MQSPSPGMAAYHDLMNQVEYLRPSLETLEEMLDDMFQQRVAEKKHGEFHNSLPCGSMPVAIGIVSAHCDCFSPFSVVKRGSVAWTQEGNTWRHLLNGCRTKERMVSFWQSPS